MPARDYETLDKVLTLVNKDFPTGVLNTLEIGVHHGKTSRGIRDFFLFTFVREIKHTGIDNQRDFKMGSPFPGCRFIVGSSIEVFNQVENNSQHFLLIDGCHNYPMTMADFLVYSDKIKKGGYVAFHDCGPQIKPFTDYQGMGSRIDPDMFISCRKAVTKLGLLDNKFPGWELVMDEYDSTYPTGGIIVVKKL